MLFRFRASWSQSSPIDSKLDAASSISGAEVSCSPSGGRDACNVSFLEQLVDGKSYDPIAQVPRDRVSIAGELRVGMLPESGREDAPCPELGYEA
jgi:hypothetical protein